MSLIIPSSVHVPAAGGGGDFDPIADVTSANCLIYLLAGSDCEEANGDPCEDTDPVLNWLDKTTHGHNFSQGTLARRPTYIADGGSEWNNEPVVRFNAYHNFLQGPVLGNTIFSGATSAEIFFLCKTDADPETDVEKTGPWRFDGHSNNDSYPVYSTWKPSLGFGSTSRHGLSSLTQALDQPRVINMWSATNDWGCIIDTTTEKLDAVNTFSFHASTLALIGSTHPSYTRYFDGDFKAILAYDAKLSSADRTAVYSYLDGLRA
jgi:hypothetical protein